MSTEIWVSIDNGLLTGTTPLPEVILNCYNGILSIHLRAIQLKVLMILIVRFWYKVTYCQTSNIRCTSVGYEIVDHSDVVGALPVDTVRHEHTWPLMTKYTCFLVWGQLHCDMKRKWNATLFTLQNSWIKPLASHINFPKNMPILSWHDISHDVTILKLWYSSHYDTPPIHMINKFLGVTVTIFCYATQYNWPYHHRAFMNVPSLMAENTCLLIWKLLHCDSGRKWNATLLPYAMLNQ